MVAFFIDYDAHPYLGKPVFEKEAQSLNFIAAKIQTCQSTEQILGASLLSNLFQLEVVPGTHQCLYAWGVCPQSNLELTTASIPPADPAGLFFCTDCKIDIGWSYGIEEDFSGKWYWNKAQGHLIYGEPSARGRTIEFATDSYATISERKIKAILIKIVKTQFYSV